jgi:predicted AAA+ superfamily ATPase
VIHNPGVIPDSRYDDPNLDITVVFEDSYQAYQTKLADLDALSPSNRSHYSFMVNSVPTQSTADLKTYVGQLSKRAEYLFATNNDQDFYESFGSDWANFTDVVGSLLT